MPVRRVLAILILPTLGAPASLPALEFDLRQLGLAATMYDEDFQVYPIGWPSSDLQVGGFWFREIRVIRGLQLPLLYG